MPQAVEGLVLDLPDPLPGEVEPLGDFLQGQGIGTIQAEVEVDHLPLPLFEGTDEPGEAVADAQARVASAEKNLRNATIRAPFAGVVSEKSVNPGDIVAPGAALFTIIDPRSLRLEASVPTSALGDVRVGAPVSFSVNGFSDRTLEGRVIRVNPSVDPQTKQVRLLASVPNSGGQLVAGLFVEGRVDAQKRVGVLVPEQAIDQTAIAPYVMRLKGGKVERIEVQVGARDQAAEAFEVRSGLSAGDTVLLGAARGISPGSQVRVSAPTDAAAARPSPPATTPKTN